MSVTYVSRLTGVGRSAVAVVAVCGPQSRELIAASFAAATDSPWRPGQIRYGTWCEHPPSQVASSERPDSPGSAAVAGEAVVLTPLSEQHFEIHAHGGVMAAGRILAALRQRGAVETSAAEFLQRAAEQRGEIHEPLLAEAEQILTQCTTQRNASVALAQTRGALLDWTIQWTARGAAELQSGTRDSQHQTRNEIRASAREVEARQSIGEHLVAPYRVVLAGPPNVGKSSLVNRIVGYARSITHDQAGTTRDVVDCDTVIAGLAIRIGDTAGIRTGGGVIEREGMRRGAMAIAAADLVVLVVDPESFAEHASLLETIRSLHPTVDVVRVLNKSDQLAADASLVGQRHGAELARTEQGGAVQFLVGESQWLSTIALDVDTDTGAGTGVASQGIDMLMETISRRLRPESLPPSAPVPITARQAGWIAALSRAVDLPAAMASLQGLRSGSDLAGKRVDGHEQ